MKIIQAESIPIRVPMVHPFTIAVGQLTHSTHVMVRLVDEQGRVGWGETTTFQEVYGYDQKSLHHILTDHLLPAVIGLDPRQPVRLHQTMDRVIPHNLMAKAGVDLAAYDLAAQAAGVPLNMLFGGSRLDRVPVIGTVSIVPPRQAVEMAEELVAEGYRTIKVKIGLNQEEDLARVEAVREAVGDDIGLRVDGNCGYDRGTALAVFSRMDYFGLEWIEQPLPAWDLDGLAWLAREIKTRIAVDESVHTPEDAHRCISLGAAEVVNVKVVKCGGIYRAQKIAAVCRAAGVPCFLGGCIEMSAGAAASAHYYAATEGVVSAAESVGMSMYTDDVAAQALPVAEGHVTLPQTPGLGVVLDEDRINHYRAV